MGKLSVYCVVLTLGCISTALADDDTAMINKAVSECLNFVHSLAGNDPFAKQFDAYYNVATGLVENNVQYAGSQPAYYQFKKCMAQHGVPLK